MENNFYDLVHRWEKNELFYKTLYEKKQLGQNAYQEFLAGLKQDELMEAGICVPDLFEAYTRFGEIEPIFNLDVDIAVWKHSRYTPPYWHSHDYFEIVCVMEGKALHRIEEKIVMEMTAGDICILPDGTRHSLEVMDENGIVINVMLRKSTFRYAFFDILSADNMLSNFFWDALYGDVHAAYLYFKTGNDAEIHSCIEKLFLEYYNHRKYFEKVLKSQLFCFFTYLLRGYEQYYIPGDHRLELEIFQYLKNHFMDATLETAAKYFNYSPAYFSRLIRKFTGQTFSGLMTEYRMSMACRLLRESNMQVGQICEVVGYSNLEHFNRQFKKLFQKSPTVYRKESRGGV